MRHRVDALLIIGQPDGNNRLNREDAEFERLTNAAYGAASEVEACAAWEAYNRYAIEHAITRGWATNVAHWFSRAGEFSYLPIGAGFVPASVRRLS